MTTPQAIDHGISGFPDGWPSALLRDTRSRTAVSPEAGRLSAPALAQHARNTMAIRRTFAPAAAVTSPALAWGDNSMGQLGDGSTTERTTPVSVLLPAGATITALAAGGAHSLALTSTGRVYAWGDNTFGQLGDGTSGNTRTTPVPVLLPAGAIITTLAAGVYHSLALTSTGQVYAWGYNGYGELGDGTITEQHTPVPVLLPAGATITALAAGVYHSLALTSTGSALAWGDNFYVQLGDGTTTEQHTPVPVLLPTGITALSAGWFHSLARTSTGSALAWGDNFYGQLGDGTTTDQHTPVPVLLPTGITTLTAGAAHSLALVSAPVLTGISPTQGVATGGTLVTINGANLTGATQVLIGGRPATILGVNAAGTQVTATTPPGTPGPATVSVTTPGGTATLPAAYTYLPLPPPPPAPPVLTGISPTQGPSTGGTLVTITGANLHGTTVTIGGQPASIVAIDPAGTWITALTLPAPPGAATVTVTTTGGTAILPAAFIYQAPPPPPPVAQPTRLTATPVLVRVFPPTPYVGILTATLTDATTGQPLAGQPITFATGTTALGTALTNTAGTATYPALLTLPLFILNNGYTATYPGDSLHQPATTHGPLIT